MLTGFLLCIAVIPSAMISILPSKSKSENKILVL
jgi:hypothetical protein